MQQNQQLQSRYVDVDGYKVHYTETGEGEPVLFIHGNPTSSFLWRNIMPGIAETGKRCIAIDLLGFGQSSKPKIQYTVNLHYSVIEKFIDKLSLKNLTLVLHDWGGPLGVKYAIENNHNVKAIAAIETFLWNLRWKDFPPKVVMPFKIMRSPLGYLLIQIMNGFVKQFIPQNIHNKLKLTPEVINGYQNPFPTIASRKAIRCFPSMIPVEGKPAESAAFFHVLEERINELKQPFLFILSNPGMGNVDHSKIDFLKSRIQNFEFKHLGPAGHYIQEDIPEVLTEELLGWLKVNG